MSENLQALKYNNGLIPGFILAETDKGFEIPLGRIVSSQRQIEDHIAELCNTGKYLRVSFVQEVILT